MPNRRAPAHLREPTRRWWASVAREYELEPHHLKLLTLLGETWDRLLSIRERISQDGEFVQNRMGELKAHPGLSAERMERVIFSRLLRELDLDAEPPPEPARPSRLRRYR
jgi:phage terminase small subunit